MVTVEGGSRWVNGDHPQVIESLRLLARMRDQEKANERAMMESDINDPRWTNLS